MNNLAVDIGKQVGQAAFMGVAVGSILRPVAQLLMYSSVELLAT